MRCFFKKGFIFYSIIGILIGNSVFSSDEKLHVDLTFLELPKDIVPYEGLRADNPQWDILATSLSVEPSLTPTQTSLLTFNKFGFDVIDSTTIEESWIIQALVHFIPTIERPVLDIGGGYGGLTKLMLANGATVIYNDIEIQHLLFGRKRIDPQHHKRLYLNTQTFPDEMNLTSGSLDAIILHRILHFLKPFQVEESLQKAYQWLAPGGKIFIVVLAPQHSSYREQFLEIYEKRWIEGNPWPGYGLKSSEALPSQAYNLPEFLHVMDARPLGLALKKYGFTVEQEGFISMKRFGGENNRDGQEAFGIIGTKDC